MWKSVWARASHSRGAAWGFRVAQNPKVTSFEPLPYIESSDYHTWVVPQVSSYSQNPRFFSQQSAEPSFPASQMSDSAMESSIVEKGIFGVSEESEHKVYDNDSHVLFNESANGSDEAYASGHGLELEEFTSGDKSPEEVVEGEDVCEIEVDMKDLESVLSLLQSTADGSLEFSLDSLHLTLHEDFVVKVIETPYVLNDNLIRFFKWALKERSFKVTTRVLDLFVQAIGSGLKEKDSYFLWDLVKDIGERENEVLNVNILNQLISSFSKLGKGKAAFEVFNSFAKFGCVPNTDTYYFTVEALCRRSIFEWAWTVCEKMIDSGSLPDGEKVGKLMSWFCKGKRAKEAHAIYMFAKEKNILPPLSSVNILIAGLSRDDETVKLALEMLNDFTGEARKYAIKPFSAVIYGLCGAKDVDSAKQVLLKMIAEGPPPGNAVFNSIVNGYSKVGNMGEALEIIKLMESRGLKPDLYTYTSVMSGYSKNGQMNEACQILEEAKRKHSKLTPVVYHTLIRGYCKVEQFDKALTLLAEVKDFGVQPTVDEYDKLIQSLCLKALDWETAEKLQEEMKQNGLYLKGITRGLIRAVKEMEQEVKQTEEISSAV